jgi:hypothetical protein
MPSPAPRDQKVPATAGSLSDARSENRATASLAGADQAPKCLTENLKDDEGGDPGQCAHEHKLQQGPFP